MYQVFKIYVFNCLFTLVVYKAILTVLLLTSSVVTEFILCKCSGLYSGFGWSTLSRISGLGARFGLYELLTGFYKGILLSNLLFFFPSTRICVN